MPTIDVTALLLPLTAGAAAESTALVATAGLFVLPLAAAALSSPGGSVAGGGAVGAVAGGGCGTPTGSEAGCCAPVAACCPAANPGDVMRGVEIGCVDVEIGGMAEE